VDNTWTFFLHLPLFGNIQSIPLKCRVWVMDSIQVSGMIFPAPESGCRAAQHFSPSFGIALIRLRNRQDNN
jgi:hypothetical protein